MNTTNEFIRTFAANRYLIVIDSSDSPKAFLDLLEKFSPRWNLFAGVHVLQHTTQLSLEELNLMIRGTLPDEVAYFVAIVPESEFVPSREAIP